MKFSYKAFDEVGTNVSGTIEADNQDAAYSLLSAKGLLPTEVKSGESPWQGSSSHGR